MAELILFDEEQREERAAKYEAVCLPPTCSFAFTCAWYWTADGVQPPGCSLRRTLHHHRRTKHDSHPQECGLQGRDSRWLRRRSNALPASESDDSMLTPISSTGT